MPVQQLDPFVQFGGRFAGAVGSGRGRFVDYIWPEPGNLLGGSINAVTRNNVAAHVTGMGFTGFGGGGVSGSQVVNGVVSSSINSSAVNGNGTAIHMDDCRIPIPTTRSALNPANSDYSVWRVQWMVCLDAPPGAIGEVTVSTVINVFNGNYIGSLNGGFGFQFLPNGTVAFVTVTGGVAVLTVVSPAGFDYTQWHVYELWIFAATSSADAYLIPLIDNTPVALPLTSRSWAAGSKLPPLQNIGAVQPGFLVQCWNNSSSGAANKTNIHQVRIMAGPTLASLF